MDLFLFSALEDGALGPVLALCTHNSSAPALLALMTLSHIAESPATHDPIVESPKQALPRILALTASQDEQVIKGVDMLLLFFFFKTLAKLASS
jgi:hypothetical protein